MSWKRFHPDWKSILWTNNNVTDLPFSVIFDEIRLINDVKIMNICAYQDAQTWAGRSNVVRLEVIYRYGGVYLDTDFLCHKPIDNIIAGLDYFTVEQDEEFVNNAIFGAVAGHPFISDLISSLQRVRKDTKHCFEIATGPHLFTEQLKRVEEQIILPSHFFYPISYKGYYSQKDYESYATHMWAYSWERHA
jgi:mannosyltransferase OCH1-like enzyme